ncbi:MAG: DUF348 domain-containing protein [Dehalococcoidia bacterium]|nr:DUF348 domain-containing protein [Dehalococcoidia bacterium]
MAPGNPLNVQRLPLNGGKGRAVTVNPVQLAAESAVDTASLTTIDLRPARMLYVHDGGGSHVVPIGDQTIGGSLRSAGFALAPADITYPPADETVTTGMHVYVRRAKAMAVRIDGGDKVVHTFEPTIGEALMRAGIAVSPVDRVTPALSAAVTRNTRVSIVRVSQERVTETESIPFQTQYIADPEREIDQAVTIQSGATGRRVRQVLLGYENGVEVARKTERAAVEQEPQPRIIHYGTQPVFRTLSTPSGPVQYWRKMRVYATWYHPGSAGKPAGAPGYGITSLGMEVQRGVIAVDPGVIPYRTQMYVPGYGMGMAADTGGGVRGNIIDLGFSDEEDHDWSSQWVDIYITGPAPDPSQIKPPA